jgi:hypothetical protein
MVDNLGLLKGQPLKPASLKGVFTKNGNNKSRSNVISSIWLRFNTLIRLISREKEAFHVNLDLASVC